MQYPHTTKAICLFNINLQFSFTKKIDVAMYDLSFLSLFSFAVKVGLANVSGKKNTVKINAVKANNAAIKFGKKSFCLFVC
jgi:hypothetical protein